MLRLRSVPRKYGVFTGGNLCKAVVAQITNVTLFKQPTFTPYSVKRHTGIAGIRHIHHHAALNSPHKTVPESGKLSTESKDHGDSYSETISSLRKISMDTHTTPTGKSERLSQELQILLYLLHDKELTIRPDHFKLITDVVEFVESHPFKPRQKDNQMHGKQLISDIKLILLKQVSESFVDTDSLRLATFFPKYYLSLRSSKRYADRQVRMDLFKILINYILLEDRRKAIANLQNLEEIFIEEENTNYPFKDSAASDEFHSILMDTLLDAIESRSINPTESCILKNIEIALGITKNRNLMQRWLSVFFEASTRSISDSPTSNNVEVSLNNIIECIFNSTNGNEDKNRLKLNWLVNLLYFSEENSFVKTSECTLNNICDLTDNFSDSELLQSLKNDEIFAFTSAALEFPVYRHAIPRILNVFGLKETEEDPDSLKLVDTNLLLASLQYKAFMVSENDPSALDSTMSMILKFKEILSMKEEERVKNASQLEQDLEEGEEVEGLQSEAVDVSPINLYNTILKSCCLSDKSTGFIESLSQEFASHFEFERNGKSFSILMNHYLDKNDYVECLDLFDRSLEELVVWGDESNSTYSPVLFKVFHMYYQQPISDRVIDSIDSRLSYVKKLNSVGFRVDPSSLTELISTLIDADLTGTAVTLFMSESIPLKPNTDETQIVDKHDPEGIYKGIFNRFMLYSTTDVEADDMNMSMEIYKFLQTYFRVTYDSYLYFIQTFLDNERPDHALYIFAEMKEKSREENLAAPTEDLYCYLFRRFGRLGYEDGVFKLHLALKMDLTLNLNIKLLNSIMEGYCHLWDPMKVRDAFNLATGLPRQIGVNEESCYFMLKVLKFSTLDHATEFFYDLPRFDIPLSSALYTELIICNCYHEKYLYATDLLHEAHEAGIEVDREMLKACYNFTLIPRVKQRVENIGLRVNREAWLELKQSGELVEETEYYPSLIDSPVKLVAPLKLITPLDAQLESDPLFEEMNYMSPAV